MIALLLNSGLGSRMGDETREHPKCMCRLTEQETIISWQVKLLRRIGVTEAVVTTGHLADTLIAYLESLDSGIRFHFVHNPKYRETNYITACIWRGICCAGRTSSACTAIWCCIRR